MENEKCFCHFNGYKVKDSDARSSIEKLNKDIATSNININSNKENIEIIKDDLKNLGSELSLSKDAIETNKLNITILQTSVVNAKSDIDINKEKIENLTETLDNIGEFAGGVAEITAKIDTNTANIETNANSINAISENIETINNDISEIESKLPDVYLQDTEVLTNKTWLDGKPIYRKVYRQTSSGESKNLSLSDLNFDKVWLNTSMSYLQYGQTRMAINRYNSSTFHSMYTINGTTLEIFLKGYDGLTIAMYLVVEYTKAS